MVVGQQRLKGYECGIETKGLLVRIPDQVGLDEVPLGKTPSLNPPPPPLRISLSLHTVQFSTPSLNHLCVYVPCLSNAH